QRVTPHFSMDRHRLLSTPKYQKPCLRPIGDYGVTRCHRAISAVTALLSPVSPQILSVPVSPGVTRCHFSVLGPRSHQRSCLSRFGSHLRWVRMLLTRCCSFGPKRLKGVLISPCICVLLIVKPSTLTAMFCSVVRFSFARYFLISGSHASTSKRVSCSGAIVCSSNSRSGHQCAPLR